MLNSQLYWGVFENKNFFVVNQDFKLLAETPAFTKFGNYTAEVKELAIKYNIDLRKNDMMRTDSTLEDLKENIERLDRLISAYKTRDAQTK